MNIINDKVGDKSSGILMMIVMFAAAVVVANVGLFVAKDLVALAALVGVFLVPVAGGQIGQAIQGKALPDELGKCGLLQDPAGKLDLGRILKLAAVVIALELALLVIIIRGDLGGAVPLAMAFVGYAFASEIAQKAAGV